MAAPLNPIVYRDWQSGMVDSVNNNLAPKNSVKFGLNVYFDESDGNTIGNIKVICGFSLFSQVPGSGRIYGLYNFVSQSEDVSHLIAFRNDLAGLNCHSFYYDGSSFVEIGGGASFPFTASTKVRMATLSDRVYAVNGVDIPVSWSGNTSESWTQENVINAPRGSLIVNFQDSLYIAGVDGEKSTLYKSSFPNIDTYALTWDANEKFLINPDDGDEIVALSVNTVLCIFKKTSLYTFTTSSTQADKIIDIGAFSQEGVRTIEGVTYFFGRKKRNVGLFIYKGDYPVEIGKSIQKVIDAIDPAFYESVSIRHDENAVIWSIGDITYNGKAYSNVEIRYSTSNGSFSILSLPYGSVIGTIRVDNDGNPTCIFGDDDGNVFKWGDGTLDFAGNPIPYQIDFQTFEFGSLFLQKTINSYGFISKNASGASIKTTLEDKKELQANTIIEDRQIMKQNIIGKKIDFSITGSVGAVEHPEFEGFEFFDVKKEQYEK